MGLSLTLHLLMILCTWFLNVTMAAGFGADRQGSRSSAASMPRRVRLSMPTLVLGGGVAVTLRFVLAHRS